MGYFTRFDGELRIEPPLTWPEVKTTKVLLSYPLAPRYGGVILHMREEEVDTDDGPLSQRSAAKVTVEGDELRAGGIMAELRELAEKFGDAHRFVGWFDCFGEDNDDIWRCGIVGREVRKVKPLLLWGDDQASLEVIRSELARDIPAHSPGYMAVRILAALVAQADR